MKRTDDELIVPAARAGAIDSMKPWNPLTDDGDALRLAMKLGLLVDIRNYAAETSVVGSVRGNYCTALADHADDAAVATRRAIVEVAAQIGAFL